jgi:hypothetical protein
VKEFDPFVQTAVKAILVSPIEVRGGTGSELFVAGLLAAEGVKFWHPPIPKAVMKAVANRAENNCWAFIFFSLFTGFIPSPRLGFLKLKSN